MMIIMEYHFNKEQEEYVVKLFLNLEPCQKFIKEALPNSLFMLRMGCTVVLA